MICLPNKKLYVYRGLDNEKIPRNVTHIIVASNVPTIKEKAFRDCGCLMCVIMGDSVKRIEQYAFWYCSVLRFIRLSKTLEFIGYGAFSDCISLKVLLLPSAVETIEHEAFFCCISLRFLFLPDDVDLTISFDSDGIIYGTAVHQVARNAGVAYEMDENSAATAESQMQVNEWLIDHMDEVPFHKICCNSSVNAQMINDYINANGTTSALRIDPHHGMTPLHMLSMNLYAPADAISSLLNSNMEAVFCIDDQQNTALDYAREYNVGGLVAMIAVLCNHRNSSRPLPVQVKRHTYYLRSTKKRRSVYE